jgi:hypothetical protein
MNTAFFLAQHQMLHTTLSFTTITTLSLLSLHQLLGLEITLTHSLLYGSLMEAVTFMKGEVDVMAQYEKRYLEALALAKRLGDGMERGDAYRDGQIKLPVM